MKRDYVFVGSLENIAFQEKRYFFAQTWRQSHDFLSYFCQFSAKKLAFFSKTNVMIKFLQK
jgi:ubiquinone biosynthesis protein Coq4